MKYLLEITDDWKGNVPNHIYILDGTTCRGYIPYGSNCEIWFAHPLKNFDKKYRKFKELRTDEEIDEVMAQWANKAQWIQQI